jgi:hypothetical protein
VSDKNSDPVDATPIDGDHEQPWRRIALIALLISLPIVGVVTWSLVSKSSGGSGPRGGGEVVDWQTLRELNHETGEKSARIAGLDGKKVRIPGFMVPLEDNAQRVSEFLLVSNPQACIHAPAPPPNQMVHVHMVDNAEAKMSWGPVWVVGRLRVSTIASVYGNSSYQLMAEATEPYKMD